MCSVTKDKFCKERKCKESVAHKQILRFNPICIAQDCMALFTWENEDQCSSNQVILHKGVHTHTHTQWTLYASLYPHIHTRTEIWQATISATTILPSQNHPPPAKENFPPKHWGILQILNIRALGPHPQCKQRAERERGLFYCKLFNRINSGGCEFASLIWVIYLTRSWFQFNT